MPITEDLIGARLSERLNPVRTGMKLWYTIAMSQKGSAPTPRDLPRYRWSGKAHRVLLIGSGPTHGWGVYSHGHSLVGQLGVAMHEMSNMPVNVDYVGEELMNAQTALSWLVDVDLSKYDQIIVALGWNDAIRVTPERIWRKSMTEFFAAIIDRKKEEAKLVVMGIEPIKGSRGYPGIVGKIGQQQADVINAYFKQYATENNHAYAQLGERFFDAERPLGSADTYRPWALDIARVAAPLLPTAAPTYDASKEKIDFGWVGSARTLGLDGRRTSARFREIADQAKHQFSAQVVQITIIDGARQWIVNHDGPEPASVPLDLTYCKHVLGSDDMVVVTNGKADDRFKNNAYLDQTHMPFYVGKALRNRRGEVLGTFCVLDAFPRPSWSLNKRRFNQLAVAAQDELWRIEDEVTREGKLDFEI